MQRCFWLLFLVGFGGVACSKDDSDVDTDTDSDTDLDGTINDGFTPYIEEGYVFCIDSGDSAGIIWSWSIKANDEQGPFTIESLNDVGAYTVQGDAEVWRKGLLACNDEGECIGSYRESQAGILCQNQSDFIFKAFIADVDGNVSETNNVLEWLDSPPD